MSNCFCEECENRGSCESYGAGRTAAVKPIAEWLQRAGFPFDWSSHEAPPEDLLRSLATTWAAAENESYENISWSIEMETGWVVPKERA